MQKIHQKGIFAVTTKFTAYKKMAKPTLSLDGGTRQLVRKIRSTKKFVIKNCELLTAMAHSWAS